MEKVRIDFYGVKEYVKYLAFCDISEYDEMVSQLLALLQIDEHGYYAIVDTYASFVNLLHTLKEIDCDMDFHIVNNGYGIEIDG